MVGELVNECYGVSMSTSAVGRLLTRMGPSAQRPLVRAYEQDPEVVRRWKEEVHPRIAAKAMKAGATVFSRPTTSSVGSPAHRTSAMSRTSFHHLLRRVISGLIGNRVSGSWGEGPASRAPCPGVASAGSARGEDPVDAC